MSRTRPRAWYLAACLMLAAFALRSLIPMGFMPAGNAGIENGIALAMCQSGIYHAAAPDTDNAPAQEATDTCPFGLYNATSAGLPAHPPGVLPVPPLFAAARLPAYPHLHASRIDGPPVGSRAPPAQAASIG